MVVHTLPDQGLPELRKNWRSRNSWLSLWKPNADHFIHADVLPVLSTGKLDIHGIKNFASSDLTAVLTAGISRIALSLHARNAVSNARIRPSLV